MSLTATRWAWEQEAPPTAKLVLLALAESVNGQGQGDTCWPSATRLTSMTGLSRRGVFKALGELEERGLVERKPGGTGRATTYTLPMGNPCTSCTSEQSAPVNEMHGVVNEVHGGSEQRARGSARGAPQPGRNREGNREGNQEENREDARGSEQGSFPFAHTLPSSPEPGDPLPDWLPAQTWAEFLEHRRKLKAPMTDLAQQRAVKQLGRLREAGHDPEEVLSQSIVNGWKGVFPVKGRTGGTAAARMDSTTQNLRTLFGGSHG